MACHHRLGTSHTVRRHRAWHAIIAFRQYKRSDDVGRGMPSPPLDSTHGRMTSGVACHHLHWEAQTVERRRRGMQTSPLGSTHSRTTSGVACQHRLWAAHTVKRCQVWHDITSFGQRIQSNNVERGMPSPPWDSTHGQTTSNVACHHHLLAAQTVIRRRPWYAITSLGQHTQS